MKYLIAVEKAAQKSPKGHIGSNQRLIYCTVNGKGEYSTNTAPQSVGATA
jgi:hypothetical protein